ncbi:MAG: hypothetical protein OEY56_06975 [Cyclobacteriaceae bacterium]|nr:hypothetical protein [Cyclobacteriaceae bacterium]
MQHNVKTAFFRALYRTFLAISHNRKTVGFILSVSLILLLDLLLNGIFHAIAGTHRAILTFDIGFAPEIWLSVLTLVLGTLIIVISIASQDTPRLIDLYLNNWPSIFFMWFIALGSSHAVFFVLFENVFHRPSSELLNTFILLPIALLSSLPYIFFILNYSKIDHVITVIDDQLNEEIDHAIWLTSTQLLPDTRLIIKSHIHLLEKVNQLMDLFSYVEYNESKEAIVKKFSKTLERYIHDKNKIAETYFTNSEAIASDISFANYTLFQFQKMEKRQSFFEEKMLRVLGNCYNEYIKHQNYELASDCCAKVVNLGKMAYERENEILLGLVTTRLNTIFRYSIKDSIKNQSTRTINNFIFQAGKLSDTTIYHKKNSALLRMFEFVLIYGNELYLHSLKNPFMKFAVAYLLAESKRSIIKINEEGWEDRVQEKFIKIILQIDDPAHIDYNDLKEDKTKNDEYRIILLGLALYYCSERKFELAFIIVDDLIKDLGTLPKEEKMKVFERSFDKLENTSMNFWEDTDRGTFNIFFSHETDLIPPLLDVIEDRMD